MAHYKTRIAEEIRFLNTCNLLLYLKHLNRISFVKYLHSIVFLIVLYCYF